MEDIQDYLDSVYVHSGIQSGDLVPIGPNPEGKQIYIDADGYKQVIDRFDPHNSGGISEVGIAIRNHFTQDRFGYNYSPLDQLEDEGIRTTEERHPYFSDVISRRMGDCAEMAIATQIGAEEMFERFNTHLVHGWIGDMNLNMSDHAFVVLENEDEQYLVASAYLLTGEEDTILTSEIQEVEEYSEDFGMIGLGDEWTESAERYGAVHAFDLNF